jgi:hypothetical protein
MCYAEVMMKKQHKLYSVHQECFLNPCHVETYLDRRTLTLYVPPFACFMSQSRVFLYIITLIIFHERRKLHS